MLFVFALVLRFGESAFQAQSPDATCPPPPAASQRTPRPAYLPCQVDRQMVWAATNKPPVYPATAAAAGTGGLVRVQFVVSAEGIVEDTAIKVFKSPHDMFTDVVRTALSTWRAEPAQLAGSAVRELVTYDFRFLNSDLNDCGGTQFLDPQTTIVCRPVTRSRPGRRAERGGLEQVEREFSRMNTNFHESLQSPSKHCGAAGRHC